ncbi:GGDEF domain-containing protein [Fictibacillus iocasae]|uniref:GGDEF domain-containing protein n=1 Tax=Fictibacillus iocasae TaxID=2715437 RepID=A0ABW2NKE4_9BACL
MQLIGRITGSLGMLGLHFIYIFYYYYRDTKVEALDLYSTPLLILIGYWCGKQYDKAKFHSEKDELTGTYNRRFIVRSFEKYTNMALRSNHKLFVILIDCDNFKSINDRFGHLKGDLVLTQISRALIGSTRKSDIIARWGGDEFLLIGLIKEDKDMVAIINRIDQALHSLKREIGISIGASIGSAIFPSQSKDLVELIKMADHNMYTMKASKKEPLSVRKRVYGLDY